MIQDVCQSRTDFLIVDDDEVFRLRLARSLIDRGFSAIDCSGVDDAIAFLELNRFSRAVIDLKMPGKSGLELIEYVAINHGHCNALVLTGYGSIATALSAVKLGAVNYLTKPASVTQILGAFNRDSFRQLDLAVPSLPEVQWEHIQRVVSECNGNISQAAKLLKIHRRSLQRKLQRPPSLKS